MPALSLNEARVITLFFVLLGVLVFPYLLARHRHLVGPFVVFVIFCLIVIYADSPGALVAASIFGCLFSFSFPVLHRLIVNLVPNDVSPFLVVALFGFVCCLVFCLIPITHNGLE